MKNNIFIAIALIAFANANSMDNNTSEYTCYRKYKKSLVELEKKNELLRTDKQYKNLFKNDSKYFNRWIKMPHIKNIMKIDNVFIPEIVKTIDKARKGKKTYLGVVHLTHFKIVPYAEKDIGKFIGFKANIIKTFTDSTGLANQKKITFYYILRYDDVFQADFASNNIVLLEEKKNNLYINPYLILPPKKELIDALQRHYDKSKVKRDK